MNAETIVFIHEHLTEFFSDKEDPIKPPGVKNRSLVDSAASRPMATAGGKDAYPSPFLKAAALFHSVVGNHAFHNGNKRAALLATLYFLSEWGYWVDRCDDNEMYEFTRRVAAHELVEDRNEEVAAIADWLERHSRKVQNSGKPMKLQQLRESLLRFGYELLDRGMLLDVIKDGKKVESVLKRGAQGFEDYDGSYISDLRKRLNLTAEHGVDAARFYGQKGIAEELNVFMQLRIDVMKRLAKI